MQINASLSALSNLLALIQESNPKFAAVTEDQLSVVSVSAQTPDADGNNAVVAVKVDSFDGQASFTYRRLGLSDNAVNPSPSVYSIEVSDTDNVASIQNRVLSILNLVAGEVSFSCTAFNQDGTLAAPAGGGGATLIVASNTASLVYADSSAASFALVFPQPAPAPVPSISTLVDNSTLNGFQPAQAPTPTPAPAPTQATDGSTPAAPASSDSTTTTTTTTTTTAPAADGTSASTTTTAPATDASGTTATPSADNTTPVTPAAPAASTDGTSSAPAASTDASGASATPSSTN